MWGEDSSVMEQEGSKSKSRRVRLIVSRYGQDDDGADDDFDVMIYVLDYKEVDNDTVLFCCF